MADPAIRQGSAMIAYCLGGIEATGPVVLEAIGA